MGFCIEVDRTWGLEIRRESVKFNDATDEGGATDIFATHNGHVELTKTFLAKVLRYFDDPAHRAQCGLDDGEVTAQERAAVESALIALLIPGVRQRQKIVDGIAPLLAAARTDAHTAGIAAGVAQERARAAQEHEALRNVALAATHIPDKHQSPGLAVALARLTELPDWHTPEASHGVE